MGIHLCVLFFLQIICYSSIEAYPGIVGSKSSMLNKILDDSRMSSSNILPIWLEDTSRSCNIEKPPEKSLTDPTFLQFGFVPYLCVILYDASLRYLNISHVGKEGNSVTVQKIIEESTPVNTFCKRMRENNWNTSIEENKSWVSNFNDHMKNGSCQRYCVSGDVLNPLCAFALWIDSAVKSSQADRSLPAKVLDPHVSSVIKSRVNPAETNAKQPHTEITGAQVAKHDPSIEDQSQHFDTVLARKDPDVEKSMQHKDTSLAGSNHVNPPRINPPSAVNLPPRIAVQIPNTADALGNRPVLMQHPPLHVGGQRENGRIGNNPGSIDPAETGRPFPSPIDGFSPALKNNDNAGKTSIPSDILGHNGNVIRPQQVDKLMQEEAISKPKSETTQKVTKPEIETRTEVGQPAHSEQSVATSVTNTFPKVGASAQGLTGPNAETPPTYQQGGRTIEGQDQGGVSLVPVTLNDGSVGGSMPAKGDQDAPPNNIPSADSPLVPEPPKKLEPSGDKTEKEKMNTTAPVTKGKEEPGNNKAETAAQLGKSDTEDANQANEGDADNAAIDVEPNNHEEQKDMDDVEAISQGEDGDTALHGGNIPAQEDPSVQQDYTVAHRFHELDDDDEPPPKPDASSTKLANDYGSDEADGTWLQGQQERGSQNDADGGFAHDRFVDAEDSHFFAYFMTMIILCILGYLIFHNKQKILALALEGRVRKGSRRRPSTSGYRKLDSNLEEAVTSSCTGSSVTHVIY